MALRIIVKYGDELLRQRSREVEIFDDRLAALLDDMKETMERENGAGLAAVQIGIPKRIAVIGVDKRFYELINPVIVKSDGETKEDEGCLSVPGRRGAVARPQKITVRAQDRKGKWRDYTVKDYTARAFCHEIDHMNGVLFIDKLVN